MEISSRTTRTIFNLSQRIRWNRWISLSMSSSRIIWKELWMSITLRTDIRRDTTMAIRHTRRQSRESPDLWWCYLLWDTRMWFRCVVFGLERHLRWSSTMSRRKRWRELWSLGNESMWWRRRISMFEWNVYSTRILSWWRIRLSRLVRWNAIQGHDRVSIWECE